jgi:hypothetical protein
MSVRDIDVAAAEAALAERQGGTEMPVVPNQGGAFQPRNADGTFAPVAPANTPAPTETPAAVDPAAVADPVTPPEAGTEEPTFTHIDPSTLSPELQQLHRSLQADYTRKTQEAAPWRKLGQELGVENPEDFRAALEVYNQLRDPRNWPAITQELTGYMQQMGMTPQQAQVAAAESVMQFAPDTVQPLVDPGEFEDFGVPPQLLQAVQAQQQQLAQLTNYITQQEQQRQAEAQFQTVAQHLTRMENQIREANPHYTDGDVEAIYNLMGNDGNLFAAQQKYESLLGSRLSSYLQGKGQAHETTPHPVQGGLTQTAQPPAYTDPNAGDPTARFDMGHRAAMAHIRELEKLEAQS